MSGAKSTRELPARPSKNTLRKQASGWPATRRWVAEAQRRVAADHGVATWAG